MIMKNIVQINRKLFLMLMPIALILLSFQYQKTNDIIGKWTFSDSPRNSSPREIEIYKQDNKYYGKIIKVAGNNNKEKVGQIILNNFVFDESSMRYIGKVHSPSGMTASCKLVLLDENKLQISVQKFFIINKSYTLTRIK